MNKNIFARILLQHDGTTHIALLNYKTYACTAIALRDLITNPENFLRKTCLKLKETTREVNPLSKSLHEIKGLTLAVLSNEKELSFRFTDIFLLAYKNINTSAENDILNLHSAIDINYISDIKQMLLKQYFESYQIAQEENFTQNISLSFETQRDVFNEIINACYEAPNSLAASIYEAERISENSLINTTLSETTLQNSGIPLHYVKTTKFAEIKDVTNQTVRTWINKKKLRTPIKDEKGQWWIDPKEKVPDLRAGRNVKKDVHTGWKNIRLKGESYEDLQEYIKKRNLVTDAIRPFIRNKKEISYYEKHYYHEVCWDGKSALIIDINPYYFSKKHGMTNGELIKKGKSPVIPGDEEHHFHLHHIGQKDDSPFAIIPESDHNSEEFYSVFHPGKTNDKNLHDISFELEKQAFWNTYLEKYFKNGGYSGIEYLNAKHKRKPK